MGPCSPFRRCKDSRWACCSSCCLCDNLAVYGNAERRSCRRELYSLSLSHPRKLKSRGAKRYQPPRCVSLFGRMTGISERSTETLIRNFLTNCSHAPAQPKWKVLLRHRDRLTVNAKPTALPNKKTASTVLAAHDRLKRGMPRLYLPRAVAGSFFTFSFFGLRTSFF
jgi:hypothetical protein